MSELLSISTGEWLDFLLSIPKETNPIARHYFQKEFKVDEKTNQTLVTQVDLEIETLIREKASKHYPELAILGEEFGACDRDAPFKLIVDPLDGTANFVRGIPFVATLLSIEVHQKTVAAVISSPITNEIWHAGKGLGAFYNSTQIHVSKEKNIQNAQSFYGGLYGPEAPANNEALLRLLKSTKRQRGVGDYLMHCLVAMGCGEIAIDFNIQAWDMSATAFLVQEAGGMVTHTSGTPFSLYEGCILSSNRHLHKDAVAIYNLETSRTKSKIS